MSQILLWRWIGWGIFKVGVSFTLNEEQRFWKVENRGGGIACAPSEFLRLRTKKPRAEARG